MPEQSEVIARMLEQQALLIEALSEGREFRSTEHRELLFRQADELVDLMRRGGSAPQDVVIALKRAIRAAHAAQRVRNADHGAASDVDAATDGEDEQLIAHAIERYYRFDSPM